MMKELLQPIRHVLRLTVEAETPLSISSGEPDADQDTALFRDWNGLPCLSGTSVAGVLRSLHLDRFDDEALTNDLFGYETAADQNGQNGLGRPEQGSASRLLVSFGLVHDSSGRAVTGYLSPLKVAADEVLRLLAEAAPILRDHVAISHQGAAREHLKFDRSSCPKGTRFSLELALNGGGEEVEQTDDAERLREVGSLFSGPYARFGGGTRRGLGRLRIVKAWQAAIDRTGRDGRTRWIAYRASSVDGWPQEIAWTDVTQQLAKGSRAPADWRRRPVCAEIRLAAKHFWRIGQGVEAWSASAEAEGPDLLPPSEPVIVWPENGKGGRATIKTRPLAPVAGASVKGAIAHRMEFHLRRLKGAFAGEKPEGDPPRISDALFGSVAEEEDGCAGVVLIDDIYVDFGTPGIEQHAGLRTRNSLDRHTAGVRLQKLFNDEALYKGPELVIPLVVLARAPRKTNDDKNRAVAWRLEPLPAEVITALDWTLDDLCTGRLALGGRVGAGDGVFAGSIAWSASLRETSGLPVSETVEISSEEEVA